MITYLSCYYPWWFYQRDCWICTELFSCERTHTQCYPRCYNKNWVNRTRILSFWSRIRIYKWRRDTISPDESYSHLHEYQVITLAEWSTRILLRKAQARTLRYETVWDTRTSHPCYPSSDILLQPTQTSYYHPRYSQMIPTETWRKSPYSSYEEYGPWFILINYTMHHCSLETSVWKK